MLDIPSRLLRGEPRKIVSPDDALANGLSDAPRALLAKLRLADPHDSQRGGGIPPKVEEEPALQQPGVSQRLRPRPARVSSRRTGAVPKAQGELGTKPCASHPALVGTTGAQAASGAPEDAGGVYARASRGSRGI
jgi:hypothetical protein